MSKTTILFTGGRVSLAAAGAAPQGPKAFSGVAYTGGQLQVSTFFRPVVVDLSGLRAMAADTPILLHHDPAQIVGHGGVQITGGEVKVAGRLTGGGAAAGEVEVSAAKGFPWKLSIGVHPTAREFVDDGEAATANGRTWQGPINIIRAGELVEISFVPIAADSQTYVNVAARGGRKAVEMTFEQWLQDNGFEPDNIGDKQRAALQAAHAAAHASPPVDPTKDMRDEAARLAGIRAICRNHPEIEAEAIEAGWSKADCELAILRAGRTKPPMSTGGRRVAATGSVLEAALCLHLGAADVAERQYDERTVQAARDMRIRHTMDIVEHGLRANHIEPRGGPNEILRASWSTNTIGGILSNVANKVLLNQYRQFPSIAKLVSKKLSAANFKEHTGFRLTGANTLLEEVGNAGEIKHGSLAEASYTYRIATYAKMFGLTRQDIINDDLGALNEVPRLIARGAALKLESLFWTLVLANTGSFFSKANGNYFDGEGSALSAESLGTAVQMLRSMTDAEGEPVMLTPKSLVVPPELEAVADALYSSLNIVVAGQTDVSTPDGNIFAGKYKPETVPHLSNQGYAGYSSAAWYLFCDPADTPAFGVSFLNNVEFPTIETADADFNKLGIQFRGYHDFGVCQIDTKGAIKSKGAE